MREVKICTHYFEFVIINENSDEVCVELQSRISKNNNFGMGGSMGRGALMNTSIENACVFSCHVGQRGFYHSSDRGCHEG